MRLAFQVGGTDALHNHPQIQPTNVESGRLAFMIDGEHLKYSTGNGIVIPSNAVHGCAYHEAEGLMDTFTPRRDVFV